MVFSLLFSCQELRRGWILFPLEPGLALRFGGSGPVSPGAGEGCAGGFADQERGSWWQQQAAEFRFLKFPQGRGPFSSTNKNPLFTLSVYHVCLSGSVDAICLSIRSVFLPGGV